MSGAGAAMRPRILLVEDNRSHADAVTALLGGGFEIVRTIDGREARARLATDDAFDVILSDIVMPRMSGFGLLQWIRGERPKLAARVVFLTADPEASMARALGDTHHVLRKPATRDELHAAIQAVLARR